MGFSIGSDEIAHIDVGDTRVGSIYIGDNLVYESGTHGRLISVTGSSVIANVSGGEIVSVTFGGTLNYDYGRNNTWGIEYYVERSPAFPEGSPFSEVIESFNNLTPVEGRGNTATVNFTVTSDLWEAGDTVVLVFRQTGTGFVHAQQVFGQVADI